MKNNINNQLQIVQSSIDWMNSNLKGEKHKKTYDKMVNFRRNLNKIKYAIEENPAAAVYGESQVGKSYLISSLLSSIGDNFKVIDSENKYDFIKEINPIGDGFESTSLVTRFSLNYNWIKPSFPVKVKLLSVIDVVLFLCDTYYNDLKLNYFKVEDFDKDVEYLFRDIQLNEIKQNVINEDDILDIRDYFKTYLESKAGVIVDSSYFDEISKIINQIDYSQWGIVFSLLWNKNNFITDIFNKLIRNYKEIDFANEVYVPINAVLREYGTLLDVKRLGEIGTNNKGIEEKYAANTNLLFINRNGFEVEKEMPKSYLCAMAAEVVFKLPQELKNTKPFLEKTDLLDFPGARARLEKYENDINSENVPEMILRGKIAYLFNKYSENYKINSLLFCHDKRMAGPRFLPEILSNWINNIVGSSIEEREEFIRMSKIAPLFVVCTKFNLDLKLDHNDSKSNRDTLINRWQQRFTSVLEGEIFDVNTYDWFNNWTFSNKYFQNIYLLRGFLHSSEQHSQLYRGYNVEYKELEEIIHSEYPDFRDDLKKSFLDYDFMKLHFKDPEEFWNRATSINEDGSGLIIKNLTLAADNINAARNGKFTSQLNSISANILNELKKHFHSNNSDALIEKAKTTAGDIQFKLDIAFGKNPYFFGEMMKRFIISEREIINLYRGKLRSIEITQNVNLEKYTAIRLATPELNPNTDFDTNLEALRKKYEKASIEDCKKAFNEENIDLNELFYGNKNRIKNYSVTLAETLEEYWFDECLLGKNYHGLISVLSESSVIEIIEMLRLLYQKLKITERVANNLRKYVDRFDNIEDAHEMIADISAETINRFINCVGYSYYSPENISEIKIANEKNKLGLSLEHDYLSYDSFDLKKVATLFEVLDNLPDLLNENPINQEVLKNIPSYSNYKKWRDLLKFGFISVCDIPNYNVDANKELGMLLNKCEEISFKN